MCRLFLFQHYDKTRIYKAMETALEVYVSKTRKDTNQQAKRCNAKSD